MDSRAIVQALMDCIQKADFARAKCLLADDFMFSGPVPRPVAGDAWLAMSRELKTAFPDLGYHFYVMKMVADTASISSELSGAHTGDLDLRSMNMGVIPATHRAFSAERETGKVTVRGEQVIAWAMEPSKGAGLTAILTQLGIQPRSTN